jgi:hypothetical protein
MRTSLWITNRQTSIFAYRMSCFAQVGRLHAYLEQYFEDAVEILGRSRVIGDELTLPRSLKHHRIAILAPAIHREPAPRRTLNDVRPTNPTLAETDGPEVTGLVSELNQFCFATLVARRLDLHRLRSAFGSDLSSVTSTTMLATV